MQYQAVLLARIDGALWHTEIAQRVVVVVGLARSTTIGHVAELPRRIVDEAGVAFARVARAVLAEQPIVALALVAGCVVAPTHLIIIFYNCYFDNGYIKLDFLVLEIFEFCLEIERCCN